MRMIGCRFYESPREGRTKVSIRTCFASVIVTNFVIPKLKHSGLPVPGKTLRCALGMMRAWAVWMLVMRFPACAVGKRFFAMSSEVPSSVVGFGSFIHHSASRHTTAAMLRRPDASRMGSRGNFARFRRRTCALTCSRGSRFDQEG
jgi:hypothetical protein